MINHTGSREVPMKARSLIRLPLLTIWSLLLATVAFSQTAQISGPVTDATGAAVPGAQVVLTNIANGLTREVNTNNEGTYFIQLLPPGDYEIAVRKQGFKPLTR